MAQPPGTRSSSPGERKGGRAIAWALVGLAALRATKAGRDEKADGTSDGSSHGKSEGRPPGGAGRGATAARTGGERSGGDRSGGDRSGGGRSGDDGSSNGQAKGSMSTETPVRPGEKAEAPTQIPAKGWWQVTRRAFKESSADNVGILAAGVAYFAFMAIFPALIAGISLYGLVADPQTIAQQGQDVVSALPETAQPLLRDQLTSIAATSGGALSLSLVISILVALWSASGGTGNLMAAINIAYDEEETRGFVKRRGTALVLTFGAIIFVLLALALVAVVPAVLAALNLGTFINVIVQIIRWVLLFVLVIAALAVCYRLAPDRDAPKMKWTSTGALVAAVLWVIGSVGFSLYVNNFGSYNKTYGALAGVVVLLLWLYLTSYIVLLGAEINAEAEKQTEKDTTTGEPLPMGERRAEAADTLADPPEPQKKK